MPGWRTTFDFEIGTNPEPLHWNEVDEFVTWVVENDLPNRRRIAADVLAGNYIGVVSRPSNSDQVPSAGEIEAGLKLYLVDFSSGWTSPEKKARYQCWTLWYDLLETPQGEVFGAQRARLRLMLDDIPEVLLDRTIYTSDRVEDFFDRPLPRDVEYVPDTVAEQIMATYAYRKPMDLDDRELAALLCESIDKAELATQSGSVSRRSYYREIAAILRAIQQRAE